MFSKFFGLKAKGLKYGPPFELDPAQREHLEPASGMWALYVLSAGSASGHRKTVSQLTITPRLHALSS